MESELRHHGIEGQKWGQRNGPPYPLDPKDYSKAEKQARGIRTAMSVGSSRYKRLTRSRKARIKEQKRVNKLDTLSARKQYNILDNDLTDEEKRGKVHVLSALSNNFAASITAGAGVGALYSTKTPEQAAVDTVKTGIKYSLGNQKVSSKWDDFVSGGSDGGGSREKSKWSKTKIMEDTDNKIDDPYSGMSKWDKFVATNGDSKSGGSSDKPGKMSRYRILEDTKNKFEDLSSGSSKGDSPPPSPPPSPSPPTPKPPSPASPRKSTPTARMLVGAGVGAVGGAAAAGVRQVIVSKRRSYVRDLDPKTRQTLYKACSNLPPNETYSVINFMYKANVAVEKLSTSAEKQAYLDTILKSLNG